MKISVIITFILCLVMLGFGFFMVKNNPSTINYVLAGFCIGISMFFLGFTVGNNRD